MSGESVEEAQIIVGTSCAGTGLDKRNVGQVIAVGLPFSIEQVLQWAGRCRASGYITVIVPSWHMRCGGELAGANGSRQIVDDCSEYEQYVAWLL
jgi:superfamily II DNA/RNA helicase